MAGMIGALFKDLTNYILYRLGIVKCIYAHIAASAHLNGSDVYTTAGTIIGFLADIITGGAIGVVTVIFLKRFSTDYWWYKVCIIANTIWLFGLGVILNLGTVNLVFSDPVFRLTSLFDHLLFGLVTVYLIYKWDHEKISATR